MDGASRVISTSLFTYSCVGALALLITIAASLFVNRLHGVPPQFHTTAPLLLLMVGTSVSLGFPLGVAGGILEGLQRFDARRVPDIVATLLRAGLIVLALHRGYGLLVIALITVLMPLLASMVCAIIASRLLPVPLGLGYVDRATFREMAGYGGTTLIILVSARLRFRTDSIVIGAFLSSAAITYFNIGARIVDYAGEIVENLAQVFVPMSSHADALGETDRLRKIFVAGNRFSAFIIFPICVVLVLLGKSVIEVWVGARYVQLSYPVLLILLLSTSTMLAQAASPRVLFGMSKHRTWAIATLLEGLANLGLSIALVRPYGIIGDAIGTALPLVITTTCFLPWHLCRQLQIKMATYLREAYWLPLILCVPLAAVLSLMKRCFVPHNYLQLLAHLGVAGLVYGLAVGWAFASKRAMRVGTLYSPESIEPSVSAVETFSQEI